MVDIQQAYKALRQADASGNTDDAKKIAGIIRKMESNPTVQLKGEEGAGGLAPSANKAIAETVGAPVDIVTAGLNKIPGVNIKNPLMGSESIKTAFDFYGIETATEEPETAADYVGAGLGEVSAWMFPMLKTAKTLSAGKGIIGGISKEIVKNTAKHPYVALASEATAGVGTGLGRKAGKDSFPDNPAMQSMAEMGGGIAGAMSPMVFMHTPTAVAIRTGKRVLQFIHRPFTESGSKWRGGKFIKGEVSNPKEVANNLSNKTIGDLPPVVASGEKRLVELYKSLLGQDPMADAKHIEEITGSIVKLEKEMRKHGYGAPDLLAEITEKRIAAIELNMDQRVLKATETAQKKLDAIPVAKRQSAESTIVRNELESAMRAEQADVKKLWNEVPRDIEVGFENTRSTYNSLVDDLAEAQKGDVPSVLKGNSIVNPQSGGPETTTIKEMQGLRSKLLETSRKARKEGDWNKARIAGDVADSILDDIALSSDGSESLKTAIAATRRFKTNFETGTVGELLKYGRSGTPKIDPSLTLDLSIGRMGTKGAVDMDKVIVSPEAKIATQKYLARSFTDFAKDPKTGELNPIRAKKWVDNNEDILDKFPKFKEKLLDANEAQKVAEHTTNVMAVRKAALRNPKISASAEFLNAADMGTVVKTVLKSKEPANAARQLVRQASKDPSGDALMGLRGSFVEDMFERSKIGAQNSFGEPIPEGGVLLEFITKNAKALGEIFTPEQMTRIRMVGRELSQIETVGKTQAGKAEVELKDVASSALKLFFRVGGAQFGRFVASITGGGTVQTPGIMSERFQLFAKYLTQDRAFEMVHDAVLSKDPKLLKALLSPIDKPVAGKSKSMKILDERINAWLGGTGSRVMDDMLREEESNKPENNK